MIIKENNQKAFLFGLTILIFFFPVNNFIFNNIYELTNLNFKQIYFYNILILILLIIISYFYKKLFFTDIFEILFILSVFFWLLFHYDNIREIIIKYLVDLASEVSIIIIFFLTYLFIKFFRNNKKKLTLFIFIFILIQYFYLIFASFQNYLIINSDKNFSSNSKLIFNTMKINEIKNKKNRNIYYVILDEMTSIKQFNHMFSDDLEIKNVINDSENYVYFDDFSSFNLTTLTLSSILNLNRIVEVGDKISNYNHNKILFPKNLSEINFKTSQEPLLLKLLNEINYKFIWFGNNWGNCENYNKSLCIDEDISKTKILDFININLLNVFLKPTPYEIILRKTNELFKIKNKSPIFGNDYIKNDSLKMFLKADINLKKNKNYFFLIHHFMPHKPYIYKRDCSYDSLKRITLSQEMKGYENNYYCAIKRINEFIKFIEKKDPSSIVVIQGDHGFKNDVNFTDENDIDKFKIFNLIKTPNDCLIDFKKRNKLGNINSVRVALGCAVGEKIKLIDDFPVLSNKYNKKFGVVKKAKVTLLEQ